MYFIKKLIHCKALLASFLAFSFSNCAYQPSSLSKERDVSQLRRPPATVEKAWLARHRYDTDRRLLIPTYSGARWGSILEYTEDEKLVYRDWWIRDVKLEDLNPEPPTKLVPFSKIEADNDSDSNGTVNFQGQSETGVSSEVEASNDGVLEPIEEDLNPSSGFPFVAEPQGLGESTNTDPFIAPAENDPFAPLP